MQAFSHPETPFLPDLTLLSSLLLFHATVLITALSRESLLGSQVPFT